MCELVLGSGRIDRLDVDGGARSSLERIGEIVTGLRARRRENAERTVRSLSGKALRDIGLGRVYDVTFSVQE